jgi:hypothetical protein
VPGGSSMSGSRWVHFGMVSLWAIGAFAAQADSLPQCTGDGADLLTVKDLQTATSSPAPMATPPAVVVEDAARQAMQDFQVVVQQNGFPAGLRTFALIGPFRLYLEGAPSAAVTPATVALGKGWTVGAWKEITRGLCADPAMSYSVGAFTNDKQRSRHAYVQIWQYDPRIANWGLRVLLIKAALTDQSQQDRS